MIAIKRINTTRTGTFVVVFTEKVFMEELTQKSEKKAHLLAMIATRPATMRYVHRKKNGLDGKKLHTITGKNKGIVR
ncbi:MAG: hypothetical protein MUF71_14650 [Candidatus Kapabacteria bacterium]|jgi:hypothetical protein|nr:hypothetical protein [Candidatus Kapabacteria bacterium]